MKKAVTTSLAGLMAISFAAAPATTNATTDPGANQSTETGHEEFNEDFSIFLDLYDGHVILRQGDQRYEYVSRVQRDLTNQGFATNVDGIYGPQTAQAVRSYQEAYNLTVDGVVGPNTYRSMSDPDPYPNELLQQGDRGEHVTTVQRFLNEQWGIDTAVDGIYGPQTEQNVRSYQRAADLTVDGIVGPNTWDSLIRYVQ